MPEGPEVKRVADVLFNGIGKTYTLRIASGPYKFARYGVPGIDLAQSPFQLTNVRTKGKLLILDSNNFHILITLGMTGTWIRGIQSHKHARLYLDPDFTFLDQRSFGTVRIKSPRDTERILRRIGHDMLVSEMPHGQWMALHPRTDTAGELLLNQRLMSGVGNIYRAEILFRAKVNPYLMCYSISPAKWATINSITYQVLARAYQLGGSSIQTYHADGQPGSYHHELQIYGRKVCANGHPTLTGIMGGRKMWYCDDCQIER